MAVAMSVLTGCAEVQKPPDTPTRVLNEMEQVKVAARQPSPIPAAVKEDGRDARIAALEQELANLKADNAGLRRQLDECQAALKRCEADRDRLTSELEAKEAEIKRLKAELAALAAQLAALQNQPPKVVEKVVKIPVIELRADALFDSGKAELRPNAEKALQNAADMLKRFGANIKSVSVEGHTDNRRIHTAEFPSNKELSEARAKAVADYLIKQSGMPADKFVVTGLGDSKPIADNKTKKGQAENRRVVVTVDQEP
jgi:flagellar motor protein MotB